METLDRHRELIAEKACHTNHFAPVGLQGLDGLQRAASRGYKIFNHHDFLSGHEIPFDKVLKTVVFRGGADVQVWKTQCVCHDGSDGDCAGGNSRNGFHVGEMLENGTRELYLYQIPDVGI